jgi:hypothetical protein
MLSHEDDGMMGQFLVVDNATSINELNENAIILYPNPVDHLVRLQGLPPCVIQLFNASGQLIMERKSISRVEQFNLTELAIGVYYFHIITPNENHTYKVIKH